MWDMFPCLGISETSGSRTDTGQLGKNQGPLCPFWWSQAQSGHLKCCSRLGIWSASAGISWRTARFERFAQLVMLSTETFHAWDLGLIPLPRRSCNSCMPWSSHYGICIPSWIHWFAVLSSAPQKHPYGDAMMQVFPDEWLALHLWHLWNTQQFLFWLSRKWRGLWRYLPTN
jgi:hypothetical protein